MREVPKTMGAYVQGEYVIYTGAKTQKRPLTAIVRFVGELEPGNNVVGIEFLTGNRARKSLHV